MLLPGDDEHVTHADLLEELQRVVDHRPAPDRQQVLVRHARQLLEPGRRAACADEALHAGADASGCDRRFVRTWPREARAGQGRREAAYPKVRGRPRTQYCDGLQPSRHSTQLADVATDDDRT